MVSLKLPFEGCERFDKVDIRPSFWGKYKNSNKVALDMFILDLATNHTQKCSERLSTRYRILSSYCIGLNIMVIRDSSSDQYRFYICCVKHVKCKFC